MSRNTNYINDDVKVNTNVISAKSQKYPQEIICICCPLGCVLHIEKNEQKGTRKHKDLAVEQRDSKLRQGNEQRQDEDQANFNLVITGNKCLRGKKYAIDEMTAPKRVVTSTVKVIGGRYPVIPVKTTAPVLKEKTFMIMNILSDLEIKAPVRMGDVIIKNVAGTDVDVVVTKSVL